MQGRISNVKMVGVWVSLGFLTCLKLMVVDGGGLLSLNLEDLCGGGSVVRWDGPELGGNVVVCFVHAFTSPYRPASERLARGH